MILAALAAAFWGIAILKAPSDGFLVSHLCLHKSHKLMFHDAFKIDMSGQFLGRGDPNSSRNKLQHDLTENR